MKSFVKLWTTVEAIRTLFFPDAPVFDERKEQELYGILRGMFIGNKWLTHDLLQQEDIDMAFSAVAAIRKDMPTVGPSTKLHPALWARWGLNTPRLRLSSDFIKGFCIWLANPKRQELLFKYRPAASSGLPKTIGWSTMKRNGCRCRYCVVVK